MLRAAPAGLLALLLLLAGCTSPPAPGSEGSVSPTGPSGGSEGNATRPAPPAANQTAPPRGNASAPAGPLMELAVKTSGQYPVNPGFEPKELSVAAGSVVHLVLENADPIPFADHDWVLEGAAGAATDEVAKGEKAEAHFPAPARGEYAFYCSVGDHRERGMEGTFTVA